MCICPYALADFTSCSLRSLLLTAQQHKSVVGCLSVCPPAANLLVQDIVTWKGELYFVDEPTADPGMLEGSLVAFTKNGQMQGIAYRSAPCFYNLLCILPCCQPAQVGLMWVCCRVMSPGVGSTQLQKCMKSEDILPLQAQKPLQSCSYMQP